MGTPEDRNFGNLPFSTNKQTDKPQKYIKNDIDFKIKTEGKTQNNQPVLLLTLLKKTNTRTTIKKFKECTWVHKNMEIFGTLAFVNQQTNT